MDAIIVVKCADKNALRRGMLWKVFLYDKSIYRMILERRRIFQYWCVICACVCASPSTKPVPTGTWHRLSWPGTKTCLAVAQLSSFFYCIEIRHDTLSITICMKQTMLQGEFFINCISPSSLFKFLVADTVPLRLFYL